MAKEQHLEKRITELLGQILDLPVDAIPAEAHIMKDLGGDSWQYLEFRTELERVFRITIPDEEVDRLSTVDDSLRLVSEYLDQASPEKQDVRVAGSGDGKTAGLDGDAYLSEDGTYYVDLELAPHHLGRCNLAETPLMKLLGHIRWTHLRAFTGVPGKQFVDEQNDRLHATFYYVEYKFPRQTPMASYGEGDRLTIVNTLVSFGNSLMDGYAFFYPASRPAEKKVPLKNGKEADALGIPYVRTSSIFVKRLTGPSWSERSRPAQHGMDNVPKIAEMPDSYALLKKADQENGFGPPPGHFSSITPETLRMEYPIEPDRDINGVGFLHSADYCTIQDIAERRLLADKPLIPIGHDLLDARTAVSRQSAYLAGAQQSDSVFVSIDAWLENPFLSDHPAPEMAPIRLYMNYEMVRGSDGKRMLVSSAEKVIFGKTLEDAGLVEPLKKLAG